MKINASQEGCEKTGKNPKPPEGNDEKHGNFPVEI
jgi:hypothetical protein